MALSTVAGITYGAYVGSRAVWAVAHWPGGGRTAFCMSHAFGHQLRLSENATRGATTELRLRSRLGQHCVHVALPTSAHQTLQYKGLVTPQIRSMIWSDLAPCDIANVGRSADSPVAGVIHTDPVGEHSGLLYASQTDPAPGSFLFLKPIADGHGQRVGLASSQWPYLGFRLPDQPRALVHGRTYQVFEGYAALEPSIPESEMAKANQFLRLYEHLTVAVEESVHRNR